MRVLLSTIGSRGDVQPLAALALELTTLGQDVRLCVAPDFQAWIAGLGLAVTPIGPELRPMMAARPATPPAPMTPEQRRALAEASVATQFQTVAAAAEGCDVIVAATALQIAARSVAEVRGIPYVFAAYCPNVLPSLPRSRADRRRARPCVHRAPVAGRGSGAGAVARSGGRRRVPARRLAAGRRAAVARRARGDLAAGTPPIYFGFGSMRAAPDLGRVMLEAARALGRRAIVPRGWADLDVDGQAGCLAIGEMNQQALFPRVAAVVHHGGAGTTTAAALAGVARWWSRRSTTSTTSPNASATWASASRTRRGLRRRPRCRRRSRPPCGRRSAHARD